MKTAIMFPGQGVQFPGMMMDIVEEYSIAGDVFDLASETLKKDIYSLTMNSSSEELDQTQNTQPCLLTCELAVLRVIRSMGVPYDAAFGFSLGEWSALAAVRSAAEQEILKLAAKRAAAMQRAVPAGKGGMATILGMAADSVSALCHDIGGIAPANYNCPGNITVAGAAEAIEQLLARAEKEGITVKKVAVSIPSHCSLMLPAAEELKPAICSAAFCDPDLPVIMNATGRPAVSQDEIKDVLVRQLTSPVLFQQSITYLLENGFDTFIEAGPGKTLSGMVRRTAKQAGHRVRTIQVNCLEGLEQLRNFI